MKEKCLQAYKRCYSKCYRALSSCPCVNNLEFELHPFLCIMLQISLVECDQSLWKGIYDYALRQIKPDQFSVFQSRIELYFAVIKGDYEPRAEWALGGPVDSKNLLTKPIIVFGDILVNPDCASDYKNAPICLQSIFDMRRFTLTYMQEVVPIIADEFSPLAPADSSSKKNPVHTVSIDSRTTVSTPESRRREQRVEQEQRKSAIGKVVSWVIAIAVLLLVFWVFSSSVSGTQTTASSESAFQLPVVICQTDKYMLSLVDAYMSEENYDDEEPYDPKHECYVFKFQFDNLCETSNIRMALAKASINGQRLDAGYGDSEDSFSLYVQKHGTNGDSALGRFVLFLDDIEKHTYVRNASRMDDAELSCILRVYIIDEMNDYGPDETINIENAFRYVN